ncbi:hypothetical protein V8G54_033693 [Vigna mungo]|uniref:Uncharacterized protein n=1 Tax=Vigna mungo TaxID=3915 RepID=A0AAQ3MPG0_VIGMU
MSATYSTRNANDPAKRVPNPLFSPLPNVAPTVNSMTTTTVRTADMAFCPIPWNKGLMRYSKETNVKANPTFKEWTTFLGSSFPTFTTVLHAKPEHLLTLSPKLFTYFQIQSLLMLLLLAFSSMESQFQTSTPYQKMVMLTYSFFKACRR